MYKNFQMATQSEVSKVCLILSCNYQLLMPTSEDSVHCISVQIGAFTSYCTVASNMSKPCFANVRDLSRTPNSCNDFFNNTYPISDNKHLYKYNMICINIIQMMTLA